MKKIYFIGIHHKAGMMPLDSKTATGKIIDKVISELDNECIKLNLFPTTFIPENTEYYINKLVSDIPNNSVFVLLGKQVQKYISDKIPDSILVNHPAYYQRKGNDAINNYVRDLINLLNGETVKRSGDCVLCSKKLTKFDIKNNFCIKCGFIVNPSNH